VEGGSESSDLGKMKVLESRWGCVGAEGGRQWPPPRYCVNCFYACLRKLYARFTHSLRTVYA
jgi:hypothetical protein